MGPASALSPRGEGNCNGYFFAPSLQCPFPVNPMTDSLDPVVTEALRSWQIQLESGIPSSEALILCAELLRGSERNCFLRAAERTTNGDGIHEILKALSPLLSNAERAIIAAGWSTGRVERTLQLLVKQRELWFESRRRILSKLVMPAATLFIASFVAPVPALAAGGSVIVYFLSVALPLGIATAVVVGAALFFNARARAPVVHADGTPLAASNVDRIMLRWPLISHIERQRSLAEFGDLLSNLLNAGAPIVIALQTTACAMRNGCYRTELARLSINAARGFPVGSALREDNSGLWPREFCAAVTVGEQSGALDATLARLALAARDRYIRAIESLAEWLPRVIYGIVALFVIWNILKMGMMYFNAIDQQLREVGA